MTLKPHPLQKARSPLWPAIGVIYPVAALGRSPFCATTMFSGVGLMPQKPRCVVQMAKADAQPSVFQKKTYALKAPFTVEQRRDPHSNRVLRLFQNQSGPDLESSSIRNMTSPVPTGDNATTSRAAGCAANQ